MSHPKLPQTDSIEELARFWDTHDLTDFGDELAEVTEPIFEHTTAVKIHLHPQEMEAVKELANTKSVFKKTTRALGVMLSIAKHLVC